MRNSYKYFDENKIFIVNRSEIVDRLDPKMTLYNKRILRSHYPMVKLKSLLLNKPQYGANEVGIIRKNNIQPRYIRITDINEYGLINTEEAGVTAAIVEKKYILNVNDIIIARSGATVGKAYIHRKLPYECIYAGYLIRFILDPNKIIPDYLFAYTQLTPYKEWIKAIQRPSAQPNINAEEFQSLEVPLPDMSVQKRIVERINNAYMQKHEKEEEAQKLLNSIDEYLQTELCISMSETDNVLNNRIFISTFKKIEGNRIDPMFSLYFGKNMLGQCYDNINLQSIANIYKGDALTSAEIENGNIPVIAGGQTSPYYHNCSNFEGNVITVSASGAYAGYVWYHDNPIYATDCCVIVSKDESRFMTKYLFEVLKLQQKAIYRLQTGSAQPHVYATDLQRLSIPDIPIEKQQEIVDNIRNIRDKANALLEEGRRILENAKNEVEMEIIG